MLEGRHVDAAANQRATASTPEAQGERDAVLAALDTLMVHLRASL